MQVKGDKGVKKTVGESCTKPGQTRQDLKTDFAYMREYFHIGSRRGAG